MRFRSALVGLAFLLVVVGCGSARPSQSSALVLRAAPTYGELVAPATMQLALEVVKRRLRELGVKSPSAALQGSDEITVPLAGIPDPARAAAVLRRTGVLDIYDFEGDLATISIKARAPAPFPSFQALNATHPIAASQSYGVVRGSSSTSSGAGWYLFATAQEIGPSDIERQQVSANSNPNTGQPQVVLGFTHHGAMKFQRITKAEYDRGKLVAGLHGSAGKFDERYVQHNAIVIDGVIEATPSIDYTDAALSLGIVGGEAVLSEPTRHAASDLAIILRSGPLPFPFTSRIRRGA